MFDGKMNRLKPSCASYAIVSDVGKEPFQPTICQPNARLVLFYSETAVSCFYLANTFVTDR